MSFRSAFPLSGFISESKPPVETRAATNAPYSQRLLVSENVINNDRHIKFKFSETT